MSVTVLYRKGVKYRTVKVVRREMGTNQSCPSVIASEHLYFGALVRVIRTELIELTYIKGDLLH